MFYGEYIHGIDRKGRLILPARLRQICKEHNIEKFFVTRGLDRCLFMFCQEEWKVQEAKFRALPFTKQESRNFNRLFFSGVSEVVPDRQGRFFIPPYLKNYAGIKTEAVLIGLSNRIEIWDSESWRTFYANSNESFEQIAENMLET